MKRRSNGKVEKVSLVAFQIIVTGVASVIVIGSIMQLLSFWFDVFSPYWLFSISVFYLLFLGCYGKDGTMLFVTRCLRLDICSVRLALA